MTDKKTYLLKEVMTKEPIEVIAKRLVLTVEMVERLKKLAKKFRIKEVN